MDAYWSLSEYQSEIRQKGYLNLYSSLTSNHEELMYTVRRLIRGLGSNRKCARIGYFSSLLWVLRDFQASSSIKPTEYIDLMEKLIPVNLSSDDSNSAIIGRLLCVRCFISSGVVQDKQCIVRLLHGLLVILKNADRRLHFQIINLISDLLSNASTLSDPDTANQLVADSLPISFDCLSNSNCYLLLLMLYEHKKTFHHTYKSWKSIMFQGEGNKPNFISFLYEQKEPWIVRAFQLAFGLAIKMNKFDYCWKLFCKSFLIDDTEQPMCANTQFVLLNVIQFIANNADVNQSETDFLISGLDMKMLLPSTIRNRNVCKSTISALANFACRIGQHTRKCIKHVFKCFVDNDKNLLSVFLFSLRQFMSSTK
ncbi:hypothetical protein GJ496_003276, partial [Pomphorhynchus laevis]